MIQTIQAGAYSSVQGVLVQRLDDGQVMIKVGRTTFVGTPVENADKTFVAVSGPDPR